MLDPESPGRGVAVREGVAVVGEWVGEEGGVEVEPVAVGLGPVDPPPEIFDLDRVAFDLFPACLGVAGVKIEAMVAGNQGVGEIEIKKKFCLKTYKFCLKVILFF